MALYFTPVIASKLTDLTKLKTGIAGLDIVLGGGLPTNGIIELSGESGSGKSQFCMQLSLTAQVQTHNSVVIYICTEDVFPSKRLQQIILTRRENNIDLGSNIFVEHVAAYENLRECLTQKIPELLKRRNVSLLIIDSVAALFRGTYTSSEGSARTQDLRQLGEILLKLNARGIGVLCVNQVTASFTSDSNVPALGLAWANLVTTRIQLVRLKGPLRLLNVLFSPTLPPLKFYFKITEKGIEDST